MRVYRIGLALFVAVFALASPARGDDTITAAERLFQEARVLVEHGDYAAACPKLEASQKLEPAVGTQFNLADCYERIGRTASAHALFTQVAGIARAAGKFERERSARTRADALAPRLARVRVTITTPAPGEELRIDETLLDKTPPPEGIPIDPGAHRLRASAPERRPWELAITAVEGQVTDAVVPTLVDPRPPSAPPATPAPPAPSSTQRTVALVLGGAGIVAAGVGSVAGLLAIASRSTAERECPKDAFHFHCPTTEGTDAWNSATRAGNVSTIAFIVSGVALTGAGVLWLTAPRTRARVGASLSSLLVEGSF
jgi:hypothetical protein